MVRHGTYMEPLDMSDSRERIKTFLSIQHVNRVSSRQLSFNTQLQAQQILPH